MRIAMRAEQLSIFAMIAVMGAAIGCGTSKPVRFYSLVATEVDQDRRLMSETESIIVIGPWIIAGYLDRPQIVTRTAGPRLDTSEYDRWAEPLDESFSRVLALNVGARLARAGVIPFPVEVDYPVHKRAAGNVNRFELDDSGRVVLDVQWGVVNSANESIRNVERSTYFEPVGAPSTFDEIVEAMNRALGRLSDDVAAALEE